MMMMMLIWLMNNNNPQKRRHCYYPCWIKTIIPSSLLFIFLVSSSSSSSTSNININNILSLPTVHSFVVVDYVPTTTTTANHHQQQGRIRRLIHQHQHQHDQKRRSRRETFLFRLNEKRQKTDSNSNEINIITTTTNGEKVEEDYDTGADEVSATTTATADNDSSSTTTQNNGNNNNNSCRQQSQMEEGGTENESNSNDDDDDDNENNNNNCNLRTTTTKEEILDALTENGMSRLNNVRYRARIVMDRAYARSDSFTKQNLMKRPTIEDLLPTPFPITESFYATIPGQIFTVVGSAMLFPYIVHTIEPLIDMKPDELNDIVSDFVPGVSILYGTMITLTLSNLYTRQTNIQDAVSKECALLSIVTKNLLSLFSNDEDLLLDGGKCVASQVSILVNKSRGEELMNMIFNDPYERIVDLIDAEEERIENRQGNFLRKGQLLANCRDLINQLAEVRAKRISQEANALSETHFTILNSLTILILFGYTISVLPTIEAMGNVVSQDTSFLFGCLTGVYTLFYCFAYDLNEPFSGAYQLRRSASATHLLQIKWNLVNHKWLQDKIDFEDDDDDDKKISKL